MKGLEIKKEGVHDGRPSLNSCTNGEINTQLRYKNYVPIDFAKFELIDFDSEKLVSNSLLSFTRGVDEDTGEIIKRFAKDGTEKAASRIAQFRNMKFVYYTKSKRLFLKGSLHTLSNNGEHNHNDFPLNRFLGVLSVLKSLFGISPHQLKILQLEWALNIQTPISTNTIIDHCIMHKWQKFETIYDNREGKYKQVEKKDYYLLKIYNKGLHYKLDRDIFRFERKQLNWSKFSKQFNTGTTLADLMNSDFNGLIESLLTNWQELLFFDPLIEDKTILFYRDPLNWEFKTRVTRKKYFDKLRLWNRVKGGNIHGKIKDLFLEKLNELNCTVLTNSDFSYTSKTLTPSKLKLKKFCLLTGLDISMQREDSSLLSHTGLKYHLHNRKDLFDEVRFRYLPKKWLNSEINIQVKEIAHNIRTVNSQRVRKRNDLYLLEHYQLNLFTQKTNSILNTHYGLQG